MTPPPLTIEEQSEAALDNTGMTADPSDNRQITGVHGHIPGVHRQITGVDNNPLRVTPDTQRDAHVVRGITPPHLIRPPVEVEDVESDDEDDEEERNNDTAPQTNVGSDVEQDESGADAPQLGRGQRVQTPSDHYQADLTNIRYAYPDEANVLYTCFHGARYGAKSKTALKQDFINIAAQIDSLIDENPPPVGLTEEQLDDHNMGVILAQHFSLKKGITLFGNKAEQATTVELQAIRDMGTYEPLDVSKLSRDEKHGLPMDAC